MIKYKTKGTVLEAYFNRCKRTIHVETPQYFSIIEFERRGVWSKTLFGKPIYSNEVGRQI